jgi:hypothetical protein
MRGGNKQNLLFGPRRKLHYPQPPRSNQGSFPEPPDGPRPDSGRLKRGNEESEWKDGLFYRYIYVGREVFVTKDFIDPDEHLILEQDYSERTRICQNGEWLILGKDKSNGGNNYGGGGQTVWQSGQNQRFHIEDFRGALREASALPGRQHGIAQGPDGELRVVMDGKELKLIIIPFQGKRYLINLNQEMQELIKEKLY